MKLTSPAFSHGEVIPLQFTGEGEDVSPPLQWSGLPTDTLEIALICEDPDAPKRQGQEHPFVHWLIYNISPSTSKIPLGIAQREAIAVPIIAHQGKNSFGTIGWGGPMPPVDHGSHRYIFRLYALDAETQLMPGAHVEEFKKAIEGHVIASAELMGIYERTSIQMSRDFMDLPSSEPKEHLT